MHDILSLYYLQARLIILTFANSKYAERLPRREQIQTRAQNSDRPDLIAGRRGCVCVCVCVGSGSGVSIILCQEVGCVNTKRVRALRAISLPTLVFISS